MKNTNSAGFCPSVYPIVRVDIWTDELRTEKICTLVCETHDEDMDLVRAVKSAAKKYAGGAARMTVMEFAEHDGIGDCMERFNACMENGFRILQRMPAGTEPSDIDMYADQNLLE